MFMNSEEIIDNSGSNDQKTYYTLNKVKDIQREDNKLKFSFKKGEVVLSFLTPGIIRIIMGNKKKTDFSTTSAIVEHGLAYNGFKTTNTGDKLLIKTEKIKIKVNTNDFSLKFYDSNDNLIQEDDTPSLGWSDNEVWSWKKARTKERFYGLGEKTGFLDKRGRKYSMWNTDVFEAHVESTDPMYVSIPFYIGFNKNNSYGILFDNSYKTHFDFRLKNNDTYAFWAEGGKLDYYFINGPELKDVVKKYTNLTGKMPLPPKWSLGYHQSRYSYKTEDKVREIANNFRQRQIPCDSIHLDIHYMDDYRVFTWDEDRFPQAKNMISDLDNKGFNLVNIVDPGVKKDPEYKVYQEGIKNDYFCKYMDGRLYSGDVWPGESVFPDFTQERVRNWWKTLHKPLLDQGVEGIWNDMNEPAVFNDSSTMDQDVTHKNDGSPGTHKRFHNLYALMEGKAAYQAIKDIKMFALLC
jgi:alpha-glucosidase